MSQPSLGPSSSSIPSASTSTQTGDTTPGPSSSLLLAFVSGNRQNFSIVFHRKRGLELSTFLQLLQTYNIVPTLSNPPNVTTVLRHLRHHRVWVASGAVGGINYSDASDQAAVKVRVQTLEAKIYSLNPKAICVVGKGLWDDVLRIKFGKSLKVVQKLPFNFGWQDGTENADLWNNLGPQDGLAGEWAGRKVFVMPPPNENIVNRGRLFGQLSNWMNSETLTPTPSEMVSIINSEPVNSEMAAGQRDRSNTRNVTNTDQLAGGDASALLNYPDIEASLQGYQPSEEQLEAFQQVGLLQR